MSDNGKRPGSRTDAKQPTPARARFRLTSIAAKLNLISGLGLLVMALLGGVFILTFVQLQQSTQRVVQLNDQAQAAQNLFLQTLDVSRGLNEIIDEDNLDVVGSVLAQNELLMGNFSAYQAVAVENGLTVDIAFATENEPLLFDIRDRTYDAISLYRNGQVEEARAVQERIDRNIRLVSDAVERSAEVRQYRLDEQLQSTSALTRQLFTLIAVSIAIGTIALITTSFLVSRSIVTNVGKLSDATVKAADGDYDVRVVVKSRDELGKLAETFNLMTSVIQEREQGLIVARREAEEATRAKDLFLATMSHELRTPLNAMIGFLGLMLYSEQLDDDNLHMAERSLANAERLLSLINNILDLSRITVGRLEIIPTEVQPLRLAEAIKDDMALRFKEKSLPLVVAVDETLPVTIVHDEERLVQIATNLLGNAIKFTDDGEVRMDLKREQDRLIIDVTDTGIGIPASKQQIIFDEFTQVDSSSTRSVGGAGLGLSIVKQLAILMQGNVSVSSVVGEGSTFTVDLPLNLETASDDKPQTLELVAQGA